jgi:ABC-type multidrug transport system permease subunit
MKKLYLILIGMMILMSLTLIQADQTSLGTFKQGSIITISQTCDNCTYVNITRVKLPNSTEIIINKNMNQPVTGNYNYNINYTNDQGHYIVSTCGDLNGGYVCQNYDYYISYSGSDLSIGQSIIYIVLILINLIFFGICIYAGIVTNGSNSPDEDGKVLPNYKKYLKIFFFFLAYIMIIWFSFNLWQVSLNFLNQIFLINFFFSIWQILLVSILPVTAIFLIFVFVNLFTDKKFRDMWERGIPAYRDYSNGSY